jgi:2-keto-4-pentenoate hydratase/2-oxohepta-3-ene-1,7-dioic acid hydratase in catechol pathway
MRLVTIDDRGRRRAGIMTGKGVVDLSLAWPSGPRTVLEILRQGKLGELAKLDLSRLPTKALLPADAPLWAPVDRPGKIVCLGLNFRSHARENNLPLPKSPILFSKPSTALNGPRGTIEIPPGTEQVDWEVELCVVIGRAAKRVTVAAAMDYVAGYTIMNDVSARDWQFASSQWYRGKSPDTFAPLGPALVTLDEAGDWRDLTLTCRVNGETVQSSRAEDMIFGVPEIVSFVSQGMTLEPGDLISTGTPSGVGHCLKPPRFLKPGDMLESEITNLGCLRNPVAAG